MNAKATLQIATILKQVPWDKVIENTPLVLEKGKLLLGKIRGKQASDPEDNTLQEMAELINEQAKMIETLSKQNIQLFAAVQALANRQKIVTGGVCFGLALGAAALIVAL